MFSELSFSSLCFTEFLSESVFRLSVSLAFGSWHTVLTASILPLSSLNKRWILKTVKYPCWNCFLRHSPPRGFPRPQQLPAKGKPITYQCHQRARVSDPRGTQLPFGGLSHKSMARLSYLECRRSMRFKNFLGNSRLQNFCERQKMFRTL